MERRRLLLAGVGVGGLLLGLLLLTTVFGGDDAQEPVRAAAPAQPSTTAVPTTVPSERASLPLAAEEGRDPFLPVVAVPKVLSVQGSQQATAVASQPTATTAPSSGRGAATAGYASLELKSISQDPVRGAQITVDGQTSSVAEGGTFSYGYRLERVGGSCVEVSAAGARAEMCLPTPAP